MKNKNLRIVVACVAVVVIAIALIYKYNTQWKYAMFLESEIDALREFKGVTSVEELPPTYISLEKYYDLHEDLDVMNDWERKAAQDELRGFVNSLGVLNSDGEYNDFELTFYTEDGGLRTGTVAVRNNQFFVIKYNPARDSYSVKAYPATALAHERRIEEAADGYTYNYLDRFLVDEDGERQIIYKTVGKQDIIK